MVTEEVYFNHRGGRYIYRLHNEKASKLCNGNGLGNVQDFLKDVITNCPNEHFQNGPRSSCLKFKLVDDILEVGGHEVSSLAKYGLEVNKDRFKDAHSKVQVFMLEHDKSTVAMEVPIWLHPSELAGYNKIFQKGVLTGHIDLLRIEDDQIWIWDYKPNAQKEKYASTQTFFYAYMLSKRTGIPLERFRCGYFDQHFTFVFKPEQSLLLRLNDQTTLVRK